MEPERAEPYVYFMIRVQRSSQTAADCTLVGLVEQLSTGEKQRFASAEELIRIVCHWPAYPAEPGGQPQPEAR